MMHSELLLRYLTLPPEMKQKLEKYILADFLINAEIITVNYRNTVYFMVISIFCQS